MNLSADRILEESAYDDRPM